MPAVRWRPRLWHAPLVRATKNGLVRALIHVLILLGAYQVYRWISVNAPRQAAVAHAHAASLIALEHRLGILIEPAFQHAALHHDALFGSDILDGAAVGHLASLVYTGSHLQWLAAMLVWLYLLQRRHFTPVRNLVVVSTLLAVIASALYAVAPPRFTLAGAPYGLEDVLHPRQAEQVLVRLSAFDPYSSLPSGHTLWALLTGLGLFLSATTVPQRLLSTAFPLVIVCTVIVTGNHYVLDCVGSMALLAACIMIGSLARRRFPNHLRAHHEVAGPSPDRPAHERRRKPNLRPLDHALILCGIMATLQIVSSDTTQRLIALGLIACAGSMVPFARHRALIGKPLRAHAPVADWWCGFLFIAGTTTIGADDATARLCASLLWLIAGILPLAMRLRGSADAMALSTYPAQHQHLSWKLIVP
jgi:PAP2 superfamily